MVGSVFERGWGYELIVDGTSGVRMQVIKGILKIQSLTPDIYV